MPQKTHDISAKDFRDPLLIALGKITDMVPLQAVEMEKCYPYILENMDIESLDEYGYQTETRTRIEHWIGRSFRSLVNDGLGHRAKQRGWWGLTEEGVRQARINMDLYETFQEQEDEEGSDTLDPYLLSCMIQATECFGYYSSGSDICRGCLLKSHCEERLQVTLREMAKEISKEEYEEGVRRSQEERMKRQMEESAELERRVLEHGGMVKPCDPGDWCVVCQGEFEDEEMSVWERGTGVYHLTCFLKEREG